MLLIFVFSGQPKPPPAGHSDGVYFSGVMPIFTEQSWETLVKKGSHMAGYGLLAVLILRALQIEQRPVREAAHLAILLAVSYALTDELHQAFIPGRHASVLDIGIDYVGAASACLLARYVLERRAEHERQQSERYPWRSRSKG